MIDYQMLSTLGQGSYGKVKLAQHKSTGIKVAIKILQKNKIMDHKQKIRVDRQICILKNINHNNITKLYQIIEDQQTVYLIMQYAQKGDMLQYLKINKKLTEYKTAQIITQLISTLIYLHIKGIAHRDIKLGNMLLDNSYNLKLADFGLSNMYRNDQKLNTSCGSPCFAAPEVICGRSYQPSKSDIWSVGVVTYALLSGTLPFHHNNIYKLYDLVYEGKYEPIPSISSLASQFIKQLLQVNPDKRPSFKQLVQSPFLKQQFIKIKKMKQDTIVNSNQHEQKLKIAQQILITMNYQRQQVEDVLRNTNKTNPSIKTTKLLLMEQNVHKLRELLNKVKKITPLYTITLNAHKQNNDCQKKMKNINRHTLTSNRGDKQHTITRRKSHISSKRKIYQQKQNCKKQLQQTNCRKIIIDNNNHQMKQIKNIHYNQQSEKNNVEVANKTIVQSSEAYIKIPIKSISKDRVTMSHKIGIVSSLTNSTSRFSLTSQSYKPVRSKLLCPTTVNTEGITEYYGPYNWSHVIHDFIYIIKTKMNQYAAQLGIINATNCCYQIRPKNNNIIQSAKQYSEEDTIFVKIYSIYGFKDAYLIDSEPYNCNLIEQIVAAIQTK